MLIETIHVWEGKVWIFAPVDGPGKLRARRPMTKLVWNRILAYVNEGNGRIELCSDPNAFRVVRCESVDESSANLPAEENTAASTSADMCKHFAPFWERSCVCRHWDASRRQCSYAPELTCDLGWGGRSGIIDRHPCEGFIGTRSNPEVCIYWHEQNYVCTGHEGWTCDRGRG
jgi:hypothetical protein